MNFKAFFSLVGLVLLLFCTAGTAQADEDMCQACHHGDDLAFAHHELAMSNCMTCHQMPSMDIDCTASGCHIVGDLPASCKETQCYSPETLDPPYACGFCGTTITLENDTGCFGPAEDTLSEPGADDGVYRIVDCFAHSASAEGTYTALDVTSWADTQVVFDFAYFYEDNEPRNYIQDADEPTFHCPWFDCTESEVRIRYVYYSDDDSSGDFTEGDHVSGVDFSTPKTFELSGYPEINAVHPGAVYRRDYVDIIGYSLGCSQGNGEVRISSKKKAKNPQLGLGRHLNKVRLWSNTLVDVRVTVPTRWQGKTKYIWVERCGMKSNYKALEIVEP